MRILIKGLSLKLGDIIEAVDIKAYEISAYANQLQDRFGKYTRLQIL